MVICHLLHEAKAMTKIMSYSSNSSMDEHRLSGASEASEISESSTVSSASTSTSITAGSTVITTGSTVVTESTVSTSDDSNISVDSQVSCQNIRVVARIRPLSVKEVKENSKQALISNVVANSIQADKKGFIFDKVFQAAVTQKEVYEQTAGDMIQNHLFKGFNVTVLAYGQTGSGKTHTIFGANGNRFTSKLDEAHDGVIPRAVHDLFNQIQSTPCGEDRIKIDMSFLEIYNEEAKDLLSTDANPPDLSIRESVNGVVVKNLSRHSVVSPNEVAALMISAAEKRSVASTLMNEVSSRSHAICTLYMTMKPLDTEKNGEEKISSKLTLVDLAGSERIKKTGAEGLRLKEGININKGLFVLGQVVSALSELAQQDGSSDNSSFHVNYRDSKLTRLLQDSLGGNSKTVMVACVSPADSNVEESVNTLRYAERTRSIKNSAVRNVLATSLSPAEAAALKKENQMLKLQLFQAQAKLKSYSNSHNSGATEAVLKTLSEKLGTFKASPTFLRDGINGLNVRDLDTVTKLMLHCTAMEEKIHQLVKKSKSAVEDSLQASINADKWQLKYETLMDSMKLSDVAKFETEYKKNESDNMALVDELRRETVTLKEKLREAGIDAEVSRATAAAVLNGKGDLEVAETMAMVTNMHNDENLEELNSSISAELVAIDGSIEQKEIMFQNANQERECLETMRSHFEGALKALQDEVGVLSIEREELISQVKGRSAPKGNAKIKVMKQRIGTLESKMKDLKQKAAEHTKALRLRDQAEKKVERLEMEIKEDKKKRAALQRKLKGESIERRNEQKEAKTNAARYLRDSNRIKRELTKVKESAARQERVLKRKAEQALMKQQRLEAQSKKRTRPLSTRHKNISQDRKEEINVWIEKEVNANLTNKTKSTSFINQTIWQGFDTSELQHVSREFFRRTMKILHQEELKRMKKEKKKDIRNEPERIDPEIFLYEGDEDEGLVEDSDDSDWAPTPAPMRKRLRVNFLNTCQESGDRNSTPEEGDFEFYNKMKVNELRQLLRKSGLTVSGRKSDLIQRLQSNTMANKSVSSPSSSNSDQNKYTQSLIKNVRISSNVTSDESKNIQSARKKVQAKEFTNNLDSTRKSARKRTNIKSEFIVSSAKKQKLSQETISSSLRKGFPLSSSSRSGMMSSAQSGLRKKSPNSVSSSISSKKTPPSQIGTRSARRRSPPSSASTKSANSLTSRSIRSSNRRTASRHSPESKLTHKGGNLTRAQPLATITNSAKKRRRASMTKSVSNALLQLGQLENIF